MNVLLFLLVGMATGALVARMNRSSRGTPAALLLGVAGAFIGGFLMGALGFPFRGLYGSLIAATAGAVLLSFLGSFHRTT